MAKWLCCVCLGILSAALLLLESGCAPSGSTGPETANISGKVTFGGEPVREGTVTFEARESGYVGEAELKSDGRYEMSIPIASYNVAVRPPMVEVATAEDTPPSMDYKEVKNIPNRYRSFETSGLKAEVKAGGSTADFDMTAE